MAFRSVTKVHL